MAGHRVIYAFIPSLHEYHILGIVPREFNYEPDHTLRGESNAPMKTCANQVVVSISPSSQPVTPPENYCTVADLMAELDQIEGIDEERAKARAWVADTFYAEEGDTVRTLRLRRGWSQAQLAEKLRTSQPHIVRLETRPTDQITFSTCRRLCEVFGIDMNALGAMLQHQNTVLAGRA